MKKANTKRALLASVLSLLLCVSMLIGTTFAWFTDSVVSKNNVIKSGELDVELYYQKEGETGWTKVSDASNIFKANSLWEPGYTEVVKLKVVNEGNLALKYQLGINIASETGSVNVGGEDFKLSEHIKYGVVAGEQTYTRDTAIAAVDATAVPLNTAYNGTTTKLLPKTADNTDNEDVVTMVVYMPTSVGNVANYADGAAVPTINLGISLIATQYTYEEDSFDEKYDKDVSFYSVIFDANGGQGSRKIQNFEKDTAQNLSVNTFTYDGHVFSGWNTEKDGSGTAYSDKQSITVDGTVTLYAQWKTIVSEAKLEYNASYVPAQLVGGEVAPVAYEADGSNGAFTIPSDAVGYGIKWNVIMWLESDDEIPSSGRDRYLSSGDKFVTGKHYFLCGIVEADMANNYTMQGVGQIFDDAQHTYFIEPFIIPPICDEVRAYLYVGQAQ